MHRSSEPMEPENLKVVLRCHGKTRLPSSDDVWRGSPLAQALLLRCFCVVFGLEDTEVLDRYRRAEQQANVMGTYVQVSFADDGGMSSLCRFLRGIKTCAAARDAKSPSRIRRRDNIQLEDVEHLQRSKKQRSRIETRPRQPGTSPHSDYRNATQPCGYLEWCTAAAVLVERHALVKEKMSRQEFFGADVTPETSEAKLLRHEALVVTLMKDFLLCQGSAHFNDEESVDWGAIDASDVTHVEDEVCTLLEAIRVGAGPTAPNATDEADALINIGQNGEGITIDSIDSIDEVAAAPESKLFAVTTSLREGLPESLFPVSGTAGNGTVVSANRIGVVLNCATISSVVITARMHRYLLINASRLTRMLQEKMGSWPEGTTVPPSRAQLARATVEPPLRSVTPALWMTRVVEEMERESDYIQRNRRLVTPFAYRGKLAEVKEKLSRDRFASNRRFLKGQPLAVEARTMHTLDETVERHCYEARFHQFMVETETIRNEGNRIVSSSPSASLFSTTMSNATALLPETTVPTLPPATSLVAKQEKKHRSGKPPSRRASPTKKSPSPKKKEGALPKITSKIPASQSRIARDVTGEKQRAVELDASLRFLSEMPLMNAAPKLSRPPSTSSVVASPTHHRESEPMSRLTTPQESLRRTPVSCEPPLGMDPSVPSREGSTPTPSGGTRDEISLMQRCNSGSSLRAALFGLSSRPPSPEVIKDTASTIINHSVLRQHAIDMGNRMSRLLVSASRGSDTGDSLGECEPRGHSLEQHQQGDEIDDACIPLAENSSYPGNRPTTETETHEGPAHRPIAAKHERISTLRSHPLLRHNAKQQALRRGKDVVARETIVQKLVANRELTVERLTRAYHEPVPQRFSTIEETPAQPVPISYLVPQDPAMIVARDKRLRKLYGSLTLFKDAVAEQRILEAQCGSTFSNTRAHSSLEGESMMSRQLVMDRLLEKAAFEQSLKSSVRPPSGGGFRMRR